VRQWLYLLGGLLVWSAHFFGVYIAASLFPGTALARWLTAGLTLAALGVALMLARAARRHWRTRQDEVGRWIDGLAGLGAALAAVSIIYQGLPALL
jgi:predicted phage tail protein